MNGLSSPSMAPCFNVSLIRQNINGAIDAVRSSQQLQPGPTSPLTTKTAVVPGYPPLRHAEVATESQVRDYQPGRWNIESFNNEGSFLRPLARKSVPNVGTDLHTSIG